MATMRIFVWLLLCQILATSQVFPQQNVTGTFEVDEAAANGFIAIQYSSPSFPREVAGSVGGFTYHLYLGQPTVEFVPNFMRMRAHLRAETNIGNFEWELSPSIYINNSISLEDVAALVEAAFEAGPNIHPLGKLRLKQLLPFNNGQAHLLAQTLPAGHLRGKTGRLKFRFENLSPLISNVVVRRPERGIPPLAKPGADSSSTLPTHFELSQNYPNPFAKGTPSE